MELIQVNNLSLDEIDDLLADERTRGEYKPWLGSFIASGNLAINASERFPGKKATSLKQSLKQNTEKHYSDADLKFIATGDEGNEQLLVVNMKVHRAKLAEAKAAEATEQ